jgi:hypothetical protein
MTTIRPHYGFGQTWPLPKLPVWKRTSGSVEDEIIPHTTTKRVFCPKRHEFVTVSTMHARVDVVGNKYWLDGHVLITDLLKGYESVPT